jgi:flavodoxin
MKIIVVYDSLYGNTEIIARAVGDVLPGEVQVQRVGQVQAADLETADLLVVGSPVHGALPSEAIQGLLATIGAPTREGAQAATFDTRLTWKFLERWGFAASKIAEALQAKGWALVGEPGGFFVRGLKKGPLKRGETERAVTWAKSLTKSPI